MSRPWTRVVNRWTVGAGGALAVFAASLGMRPLIDEASVDVVPTAPSLTARSIERAPLVRIRNMDATGHYCLSHSDPNIPCAMFAPGYKPVVPNEDTPDPENVGEFVVSGQKWPQPGGLGSTCNITYSYSNLLNGSMTGITSSQLQSAVQESLNIWAASAPLSFTLVADSGPLPSSAHTSYPAGTTPNLRFGQHPIDGGSGVLAHAFFPNPGSGLAGDLHFDNAENWGTSPGGGKIDFLEVCVHEIGHALGLNHEPSPPTGDNAIMNPFYGSRYSGLGSAFLLQDDKDGIQNIYGTTGPGCTIQSIIQQAKSLPFMKGLKLSSTTAADRFYADLTKYSNRVLKTTPAGQQLSATYFKHGPEVVQVLAKRPELTMQAIEAFTALQEPMARQTATEPLQLPTETYVRVVDLLKALDGLVSDDAQAAIQSARETLDAAVVVDGNTVSLDFHRVK